MSTQEIVSKALMVFLVVNTRIKVFTQMGLFLIAGNSNGYRFQLRDRQDFLHTRCINQNLLIHRVHVKCT